MYLGAQLCLGQIEETGSGRHLDGENCGIFSGAGENFLQFNTLVIPADIKNRRTYIDYINSWKRHFYPGLMVACRHFEQIVESLLYVLRPGQISVESLDNLLLTTEAGHR